MYEANTYESILKRMLDRIPDTLDKREGSIIFDALAPAAAEVAQLYIQLDVVLGEAFADTASREYLIRRASESGVIVRDATYAVCRGEFNIDVSVGDRFNCGDYNYSVTEKISTGVWKLVSETSGSTPNGNLGTLIPIDYINGLESAKLTEVLIPAEDEEETELLRERLKAFISNPSQNGNVSQYEQWSSEYIGIGRSKVFPLWNGGNTVKISITDTDFLPAGITLVNQFQEYMDPSSEGKGNGVAPIGCKVTVTGGVQKNISVNGSVVLAEGYNSTVGAYEAVAHYLSSIVFKKNSASYMRIGSALLDCDSIADLSGLTVNSGTTDILLNGDEIPVLTNINLVVTS
jgi:uncharacterized phage protein gp47/JayE